MLHNFCSKMVNPSREVVMTFSLPALLVFGIWAVLTGIWQLRAGALPQWLIIVMGLAGTLIGLIAVIISIIGIFT